MTDEKLQFGLRCSDEDVPPPVLAAVRATGRLDGALFDLTLRQTYRNAGSDVLEVVYTFPLPNDAVLLGFASELNGERAIGVVVPAAQAEQQYEEALAGGDAPVMLEALGDGLHTANIGNLKPGDEIVLEVRFAQALLFEQGRLRVSIPTTIAPRYGNAEVAGLQPQQVPQASLSAEYGLSLSVTVGGALARATIACPTHAFTREATAAGLRLDLRSGAFLDRDVVIVVEPQEALPSLVIQAHDPAATTAGIVSMAALRVPLAPQKDGIVLKLLVDCSGSMAGDSIESARSALRGTLRQLTEGDWVSLSRFGSTVEHVAQPTACIPSARQLLMQRVDAIDADLGGTEMESALKAVFALPRGRREGRADVLLITDGEIWQAEAMVAVARRSGHRVFAIGVGSAPEEGVLRSLAEATGGACEFATPGEALEAAARRMLVRIRQQAWSALHVDWGVQPVWQTALPTSAFGGDTVVAFAGMPAHADARAVRLLTTGAQGLQQELARGEADEPCPGDAVARIAAKRRMQALPASEALALALAYQLMSSQTHCILVHERVEAEKATADGRLHRVPSMLAAGWGGVGALPSTAPGVVRGMRSADAWGAPMFCEAPRERLSIIPMEAVEDVSALYSLPVDSPFESLAALSAAVVKHLAQHGAIGGLAVVCLGIALHPDVRSAWAAASGLGAGDDAALLLLAHWAADGSKAPEDRGAVSALQPYVDQLDPSLVAQCKALFEEVLGGTRASAPRLSRAKRLRRAVAAADAAHGDTI